MANRHSIQVVSAAQIVVLLGTCARLPKPVVGWGVHSDPLGVLIHVSVDVPAALSTVPTRWDDDDTRKVLAELQPDVISGAWRD